MLDDLRERFYYDGSDLRVRTQYSNRVSVGDLAGSLSGSVPYRRVSINKKFYLVHRVIWFMEFGYWPDRIDHVNGDKTDNRLENLRDVTTTQNNRGFVRKQENVTSKYRGVSWKSANSKWVATISHNSKQLYLGLFVHEVDAARVYDEMVKQLGYSDEALNFKEETH